MDRRKLLAQEGEDVLVVAERKVRVYPSLEEDSRSSERQRLLDLLSDLVGRQDVPLGIPRLPVERAEGAPIDADVRVVDVPVDLVGGNARIVTLAPRPVGRFPELEKRA
jgi:hypothetical protein